MIQIHKATGSLQMGALVHENLNGINDKAQNADTPLSPVVQTGNRS